MQVEPPDLLLLRVEAQLGKRNPQLRGPAVVLDGGPRLPDRVEVLVEGGLVVLGMVAVDAHAGGGHAERVGRPAVEKGVERNQQVLGLLLDPVPPAHRGLDRLAARLCIRAPM